MGMGLSCTDHHSAQDLPQDLLISTALAYMSRLLEILSLSFYQIVSDFQKIVCAFP